MILDPTGGEGGRLAPAGRLAPRRPSLDGATVALLENGKANAPALLSELGELLTRHGVARLVPASKQHFGMPASADVVRSLGEECDAVVTAIGD